MFEAAIRVKSTHLIKSRLKTRKKRKYGSKRNFYTNPHQRDRLDTEFTALYNQLMPKEAQPPFTVSGASLVCTSGIVIEVRN